MGSFSIGPQNQALLTPDEGEAPRPEGSLGWWGASLEAARRLGQLPGNEGFSEHELLRALR